MELFLDRYLVTTSIRHGATLALFWSHFSGHMTNLSTIFTFRLTLWWASWIGLAPPHLGYLSVTTSVCKYVSVCYVVLGSWHTVDLSEIYCWKLLFFGVDAAHIVNVQDLKPKH